MSLKLSSAVWDSFTGSPPEKLVMLALADWATDVDASVHPSLRKISHKTNLSYRAVVQIVGRLVEDGWLAVTAEENSRFAGSAREYRFMTLRLPVLPHAPGAPGGCTPCMGGDAPAAPPDQDSHKDKNVVRESNPIDASLADRMLRYVRGMNPSFRDPNMGKWADGFRLMRERDGRSPEDIEALMAWVYADDFWRANILSPDKLRIQFDRLDTKRKTQRGAGFEPGYFE